LWTGDAESVGLIILDGSRNRKCGSTQYSHLTRIAHPTFARTERCVVDSKATAQAVVGPATASNTAPPTMQLAHSLLLPDEANVCVNE
jgi:hypothetical protein